MTSIDMRSLSDDARHCRRVQVISLRDAGRTYVEIALQTGLSRTGVFDICRRHDAAGASALYDAPNGHKAGEGRLLDPGQEALVCGFIARHTPEQLALPGLLWTRTGVAQLIEQCCSIRLHVRTTRLYLARWGYGWQSRLPTAGEPSPGAFKRWLDDEYPRIVQRARAEGAVIHWGDEGGLRDKEDLPGRSAGRDDAVPVRTDGAGPTVLSTVTNQGQRRWMDFASAPDSAALIDFLHRLTTGSSNKVFLIHGNLRVHDGRALAAWLAEHDELVEVFCLPGHRAPRAPRATRPRAFAA
jgi:transposase